MSEDERSSRKVKVVDRRRFAEDGTPREGLPEPKPKPKATSQSSATRESKAPPKREGPPAEAQKQQPAEGAASSQVFLELVATLAQQAELLLVGAPGIPKQVDQAQRLIDYLAILESKTRGNLSAEESQVLSSVLFQLRTGFVQAPKE